MQHQISNVIGCCHYDYRINTKLQTRPPSSVDAKPRVKNNYNPFVCLFVINVIINDGDKYC